MEDLVDYIDRKTKEMAEKLGLRLMTDEEWEEFKTKLSIASPPPRQPSRSNYHSYNNERDLSAWAGPFLIFGKRLPTIID